MKPTIYEIKHRTFKNCPHFFDRKTLKYFGQTMKDFKVEVSSKGNIYIYAPSYWKNLDTHKRVLMGYTFRQFKDDNLICIDTGRNLSFIESYIKDN